MHPVHLEHFGLFDFHEPRITEYQKAVIENGRVSGSAIEVMPDIDELWHAIAVGQRRSR
jgi:hypothetical protein